MSDVVAIHRLPHVAERTFEFLDRKLVVTIVAYDYNVDALARIYYQPFHFFVSLPSKECEIKDFIPRIMHEVGHALVHVRGMNSRERGHDYTDLIFSEEDMCNLFAHGLSLDAFMDIHALLQWIEVNFDSWMRSMDGSGDRLATILTEGKPLFKAD